jgi:CDP-diacylglycerol--inositol 3-phosphatidyltransferase
MNLYYTNKVSSLDPVPHIAVKLIGSHQAVLFVTCALNELCFIGLYLLCFSSPIITPALKWPSETTPTHPLQPTPSLMFPNPFSAAAMEMARANKMDSTVPWIITVVSAPVMIFKQYVNVIQLVKASNWLAEGDRKDRKKLGLPRKQKIV